MSIFVKVRNGDINGAIRTFKKKVNDSGILRDLKAHEYYLTKSQKRRVKHKEALKRANKMRRLAEEADNPALKKKRLDRLAKIKAQAIAEQNTRNPF